ncbi:hypothetical protein GCM10007301_38010 [Azorhizobium oxalatiphilum]|uniref:Uncharacterized protein n=1 Tax=Azorhizobium oxalatiphilum TaxID=980631 RepID=A0A917C6K3_9HYPH|nr:hypothetical protein GCM10007301_38010 [Azorhizobium oxalatiphilum]
MAAQACITGRGTRKEEPLWAGRGNLCGAPLRFKAGARGAGIHDPSVAADRIPTAHRRMPPKMVSRMDVA